MDSKAKFTASVQHTPNTIQLLYKTEYYTYDTLRMITRAIIGCILVILALTVEMRRAIQCLLLLAGCWMAVNRDFPAAMRAGAALEDRKAVLPLYTYSFYDDAVVMSGEGSMRIAYTKFERLIEDDNYLYLFLGRKSVCMVDKSSVEGGGAEELKLFVSQRTNCTWKRNRSILSMNLSDLRQAVRDRWSK